MTESRRALEVFDRAVGREAHFLSDRPAILWQQLYNQLQWNGDPRVVRALAAERAKRSQPGAPIWLRSRRRVPQSPQMTAAIQNVVACAVSPDGRTLLTGGEDRTIRAWDAVKGTERKTLGAHSTDVRELAYAPDGSCAVSVDNDGVIIVWQMPEGTRRCSMAHQKAPDAVLVSADASRIVSAGSGIHVWDARSGAELARLDPERNSRYPIAMDPRGAFVLSGIGDDKFALWDLGARSQRAVLRGHRLQQTAVAVDPGGRFVVTATRERSLVVWSALTGERWTILRRHRGPVNACAVSPDGRFIVSASEDGTLKVWDPAEEAARLTLAGHDGEVSDCLVTPDGATIISVGYDETLRMWDAKTGTERATLTGHNEAVSCMLSATGDTMVSVAESSVAIWDLSDTDADAGDRDDGVTGIVSGPAGPLLVSPGPEGSVGIADPAGEGPVARAPARWFGEDPQLAPDGTFVVSAAEACTFRRWDPSTGRRTALIVGPGVRGDLSAVAPDGSFAVLEKGDGLTIWETATGEPRVGIAGHKYGVRRCAISPDGSLVVTAGEDDDILKVWDARTGAERSSLEGHEHPSDLVTLSPDGSFVLSSSFGDVRTWDARSGEPLRQLWAPTNKFSEVPAIALKPDGRTMIVPDGSVLREFDLQSGERTGLMINHGSDITAVAVSPDGTLLVTASEATTRIWDARTGAELGALPAEGGVARCVFSPDGSIIATSSAGMIRTLDTRAREHACWRPHSDELQDLRFAPDGSLLTTGTDRMLYVLGVPSGDLRIFPSEIDGVTPFAITADGSAIVSANDRKTITVWDVSSGAPRARLDVEPDAVYALGRIQDGQITVIERDGAVELWDVRTGLELGSRDALAAAVSARRRSPDGTLSFVPDYNGRMLEVEDSTSSVPHTVLPLVGKPTAVLPHRTRPMIICVTEEPAYVYVLDVVGATYGPALVTAVDSDGDDIVRCPRCRALLPVDQESLGQTMQCTCAYVLQLAPFVPGTHPPEVRAPPF